MLLAILLGAAWFACGAATIWIDLKDYPEPVISGVDEAFRALLFVMGPLGLAMVLFVREDIKRW